MKNHVRLFNIFAILLTTTIFVFTYQQCSVGGSDAGQSSAGLPSGGDPGGGGSGSGGGPCATTTNEVPYVQAVCHWNGGSPSITVTWQDPPSTYNNPSNQSMLPNHGGGVVFEIFSGTGVQTGDSVAAGWAQPCCTSSQMSVDASYFVPNSNGSGTKSYLSSYIGYTVYVTKKWNTTWSSGFGRDSVHLEVPLVQCNCQ